MISFHMLLELLAKTRCAFSAVRTVVKLQGKLLTLFSISKQNSVRSRLFSIVMLRCSQWQPSPVTVLPQIRLCLTLSLQLYIHADEQHIGESMILLTHQHFLLPRWRFLSPQVPSTRK